jgi:hypothetical protein
LTYSGTRAGNFDRMALIRFRQTPLNTTVESFVWLDSSAADLHSKIPSIEMVPWTLVHCWWECKLVQPLWKKFGGFLKI